MYSRSFFISAPEKRVLEMSSSPKVAVNVLKSADKAFACYDLARIEMPLRLLEQPRGATETLSFKESFSMSNTSTPTFVRQKKQRIKVGEVFGFWTVIQRGLTVNNTCSHLCLCVCGVERWVSGNNLRGGKTQSCGCKSTEIRAQKPLKIETHGESHQGGKGTPEYRSWLRMRERCYYEKGVNYDNYGGRGVRVCDRWRNSFSAFLEDMGRKPAASHTLDRIDSNLSYSCGKCEECLLNQWPANCRWADSSTQQNNKTNNKILEFNGKRQTMAQWAEELGINKKTLKARLGKYGWSVERALSTVSDGRMEILEHAGRRLSIADWARETGIHPDTIGRRISRLGWTIECALTAPVVRKRRGA